MSMLLPQAHLRRIGGLAPYAGFLAEDFFLTHALFDAGLRHRICRLPARQWPGPVTLKDVIMRQLRCVCLRRVPHTGDYAGSPPPYRCRSPTLPLPTAGFASAGAPCPFSRPLSFSQRAFRWAWPAPGPHAVFSLA